MDDFKAGDDRDSISRRTLIQGAAVTMGVALSGCQPHQVSTPVEPPEEKQSFAIEVRPLVPVHPLGIVAEFVDEGRRLFGLIPDSSTRVFADGVLQNVSRLGLPMLYSSHSNHKRAFDWLIWALPAEAAFVAEIAGIMSVEEKTPGDVFEQGRGEVPNGQLAVRLFPNASVYSGTKHPFASPFQVTQELRRATNEFKGVVINPGPEPVIPENDHGEIAEQGQVMIHYSQAVLDNKVLAVIKEHPQTIGMKWGGPFMTRYCPGCGIG